MAAIGYFYPMRWLSIVFIFLTSSLFGQNGFPALDELSFDLKYAGGKVFKHTSKLYLDPPPYSQEIEFSISHHTRGRRSWEANTKFPIPSLNFSYINYFDEDFGNALAIYPAFEAFFYRGNKLSWRTKVGGGIAIAPTHWTREDTLRNYIGSTLNNFTVLQSSLAYVVSNKIELQSGIRLSHTSNGTARQPNFGINLASMFLGVNYFPGGSDNPYNTELKTNQNHPIQLGGRLGYAFGESNTPDGPLHSIYMMTLYGTKLFRDKKRLMAGIDMTYNKRELAFLKNNNILPGKQEWASLNASIFGGFELMYGRVGIPAQIGVYIKKTEFQQKVWYQKVGFQYYFYQNPNSFITNAYFGPILKTHLANADNIEFALGFLF